MGINQYIKIGKKMKEIRMEKHCSQKETAKKLGLAISTYSNYENGYREPPMEVIQSFCTLFNLTVDELLDLITQDSYATIDQLSESERKEAIHNIITWLVTDLTYYADNNIPLDPDVENSLFRLLHQIQRPPSITPPDRDEPEALNAANDRGATPEEKKNADDIMHNPDEWE